MYTYTQLAMQFNFIFNRLKECNMSLLLKLIVYVFHITDNAIGFQKQKPETNKFHFRLHK